MLKIKKANKKSNTNKFYLSTNSLPQRQEYLQAANIIKKCKVTTWHHDFEPWNLLEIKGLSDSECIWFSERMHLLLDVPQIKNYKIISFLMPDCDLQFDIPTGKFTVFVGGAA